MKIGIYSIRFNVHDKTLFLDKCIQGVCQVLSLAHVLLDITVECVWGVDVLYCILTPGGNQYARCGSEQSFIYFSPLHCLVL